MLGSLTSDYNEGLKILKKIMELKTVKHSEKSYFIYGFKQIIYLYSTEDIQKEHKKKMTSSGWSEVEGQTYVSIYSNLYEKRFIRVLCSFYEKPIDDEGLFS